MTATWDGLFRQPSAETLALVGRHVQARDVPGTHGRVLRAVGDHLVVVRWQGYTIDYYEQPTRLEVVS